MTRADASLGEVRSILARGPSEQAFEEVCALWPEGDVPEPVIHYVQSIVNRWSDDVPCRVPLPWGRKVEAGEPCPGVAMCKTLVIEDLWNHASFGRRMVRWSKAVEANGLHALTLAGGRHLAPSVWRSPHFARVERLELRKLEGLSKSIRDLMNSPLCHGLYELHLDGVGLDVEAFELLIASPQLAQLEALSLRSMAVDDDACARLVELLVGGAGLRRLDLSDNQLTTRGLEVVLDGLKTRGVRLESLNLSRTKVDDEGVEILVRHEVCQQLERLEVDGLALGVKGLRALSKRRSFEHLEVLDLSSNSFDDEMVSVLSNSPLCMGIKTLRLRYCGLNARMMTMLSESMYLRDVEELVLSNNAIGDDGAIAIATSEPLEGLQKLDVTSCSIGDEGIEAIAQASWFARLETLKVRYNHHRTRGMFALYARPAQRPRDTLHIQYGTSLSAQDIEGLLDGEGLDEVRKLEVFTRHVSEGFWAMLATSSRFSQLMSFEAVSAMNGDDGIVQFARWPRLRGLEELKMTNVQMTSRGLEALLDSPYLVNVRRMELSSNPFDEQMMRCLLGWGGLGKLEVLVLDHCAITSEWLIQALDERVTPALEFLSCYSVLTGREQIRRLAAARGIKVEIGQDVSSTMDILPMEIVRGRLASSMDEPVDEEGGF